MAVKAFNCARASRALLANLESCSQSLCATSFSVFAQNENQRLRIAATDALQDSQRRLVQDKA